MSIAIDNVASCAACGAPIVQGIGTDKDFCSISCYRAGRAFCKFCGKPLPQGKKGRKRSFCDDLCGGRYAALDISTNLTLLEEKNRSTCKACGKPITQPKGKVRLFCSRNCTWRFHTLAKRGQKLDLTQPWGAYAPETRKAILEVQAQMGLGAAKRLAAAIDREYVLRKQGSQNIRGQYIVCRCKTCGKEFNRRPSGLQSKDYCSKKCNPSTGMVGEQSINAKLTWMQVDEIRNLYTTGNITQRALGEKYGVSKGAIGFIVRCENWKPEDDPRRKAVQHA